MLCFENQRSLLIRKYACLRLFTRRASTMAAFILLGPVTMCAWNQGRCHVRLKTCSQNSFSIPITPLVSHGQYDPQVVQPVLVRHCSPSPSNPTNSCTKPKEKIIRSGKCKYINPTVLVGPISSLILLTFTCRWLINQAEHKY